jgi:AcrR family transcriptional regulator
MSRGAGAATIAERPMRADARRNRERVLAAAEELFAEQGLRVQMADVARRAGVGVGTVCRNFPTKESLIGALLDEMIEPLVVASELALADPDPASGLRSYVEAMADLQARSRGLAEQMSAHFERDGQPVKLALRRNVAAMLRRAQDAGAVRDDIGPADLALLFCGIAQSAVLAGDVGATQRRRYLTIVLDGLRPAGPSELPGRPLGFADLERARRRAQALSAR